MLQSIVDILFPAKCSQCHNIGAYLCESCLGRCERAKEIVHENAFTNRSTGKYTKWITALYSYRDKTIKNAIWEIKFHGHFAVAEAFGKPLAKAVLQLLEVNSENNITNTSINKNIIVVPIPPSKSGGKKRGYNQTVIIARAMVKHFPTKYYKKILITPHILEKVKTTERQAMIHNKERRLKNMEGAFAVPEQYTYLIRNKIIVIVDDITTTGATLRDAKRALLKAGAKNVYAATIAH